MITVELNRHYMDNEVSLQCGRGIYATLREDGGLQRALMEQVSGRLSIVRNWSVSGRRFADNTLFHVHMDGGIVKLYPYWKRTVFLTYEEAYAVSLKLLETPGISNVQIIEHMENSDKEGVLSFADTTD